MRSLQKNDYGSYVCQCNRIIPTKNWHKLLTFGWWSFERWNSKSDCSTQKYAK